MLEELQPFPGPRGSFTTLLPAANQTRLWHPALSGEGREAQRREQPRAGVSFSNAQTCASRRLTNVNLLVNSLT